MIKCVLVSLFLPFLLLFDIFRESNKICNSSEGECLSLMKDKSKCKLRHLCLDTDKDAFRSTECVRWNTTEEPFD